MLRHFGVEPDFGAFQDAMMREARDLGRAGAGGLSEGARARIEESIGRAFRTAATQATKRLTRDFAMANQIAAGAQGDWLAVSIAVGDEDECADCDELHGEERTIDEWRSNGAPGSAARRCRANCRCELVPIRPADDAAAEGSTALDAGMDGDAEWSQAAE